MSKLLERLVGAAAQAHVGSLEIAERGIEVDRRHVRQVGRRYDGQTVTCLVIVVETFHHLEVTLATFLQPSLAVDHERQLTERHAVNHGNGQRAHATLVFHIEQRAVHIHAVGVGTVEHDHLLAILGAAVHQSLHRYIIGVEAQAHVLNVAHEHVKLLHLGIVGCSTLHAVERVDVDTCLLVHRAAHLFAGIGLATESVLG